MFSYIAGLFDGEGTVGIYEVRQGRDKTLSVAIAMTEPIAVLLIKSEFPEARVHMRSKRPLGQEQFVVSFHGLKAYDFLKTLEPFVLVKWEQVKVALTFLAHKRQTHGSKTHYPCGHCDWAMKTIADLKTPDSNGVKTVELVRRHGLRQYRAKLEEVEQDLNSIEASLTELRERVETRDRRQSAIEPMSAPEQDIVRKVA